MNALLIKKSVAKVVNLGSKIITKYSSHDNNLEINHMKILGRHPDNPKHFVFEEKVHFMLYVLSGEGTIWCDENQYAVAVGDVVDVPAKTKFAVENVSSDFEYLALQTPAWCPEQAFIVDQNSEIIEQTQK